MAFDFNMTRLLLHEWSTSGVPFGRTGALGRQGLHVSSTRLQYNLNEFGLKQVDAEEILKSGNGYWEPFVKVMGGTTTDSLDISDYEGATVLLDMNAPIDARFKGQYDTIIDSGTLEHIFNFPIAIKNCMELLAVNGRMIMITPTNNFLGHGFYQFSPELFYRVFNKENGFAIDKMLFFEDRYIAEWFSVKDPSDVAQRVELNNSLPAYLFIVARKTAQKEIFSVTPNQSDYQEISWNQKSASPYEIMQANKNKFSLARYVPYPAKKMLSKLKETMTGLKIGINGPRYKKGLLNRVK